MAQLVQLLGSSQGEEGEEEDPDAETLKVSCAAPHNPQPLHTTITTKA
jgi:hypothetical protein